MNWNWHSLPWPNTTTKIQKTCWPQKGWGMDLEYFTEMLKFSVSCSSTSEPNPNNLSGPKKKKRTLTYLKSWFGQKLRHIFLPIFCRPRGMLVVRSWPQKIEHCFDTKMGHLHRKAKWPCPFPAKFDQLMMSMALFPSAKSSAIQCKNNRLFFLCFELSI